MPTITTRPEPAIRGGDDGGPLPAPRWPLACAVALAVAPFVATAVRVVVGLHGSFHYAGDQAITALAVRDASHGDQLLGPYSRYGWAHPGPVWFYLLVPGMRLLGGDDAALIASSLLVHATLAAAFVWAFWRPARPAASMIAAGVLLLYVLRMPAEFFVQLWNPFALLLGTAVLLALAARARDGRWTTLLLLLIAGSYLLQTHVGTAPVVLAVGVVGLAAFLVGRRVARTADGQRGRARRWPIGVLAGVLVLMWVPPVVQQLTAPPGQGNLGQLVRFFLGGGGSGQPGPSLSGAVSAVGRILVMAPYGWGPGPFEMDLLTLPGAVLVGLLAQVFASLVLLLLGRRWVEPAATWTGLGTLVALGAAVTSALTVSGTVYWYLLTWITVIPLVTLVGGCLLVLGDGPARRDLDGIVSRGPGLGGFAGRRPVLIGLVVLLVGGSVGTGLSLSSAVKRLPSSAGVAAFVPIVEHTVADAGVRRVHIELLTHDRWPILAGLVETLEAHGIAVTVGSTTADLFGASRINSGNSGATVSLVAPDDPLKAKTLQSGARELATVDTEYGPITLLEPGD